jgi:hypothetical protein
MAVPKMVINGIISPFGNWVCSQFPFKIRTAMVDSNMRSTIKTIFNQLWNKHAHFQRPISVMSEGKKDAVSVKTKKKKGCSGDVSTFDGVQIPADPPQTHANWK